MHDIQAGPKRHTSAWSEISLQCFDACCNGTPRKRARTNLRPFPVVENFEACCQAITRNCALVHPRRVQCNPHRLRRARRCSEITRNRAWSSSLPAWTPGRVDLELQEQMNSGVNSKFWYRKTLFSQRKLRCVAIKPPTRCDHK